MEKIKTYVKYNSGEIAIAFLFFAHLLGNLFYFLSFDLIIAITPQRIATVAVGAFAIAKVFKDKSIFKNLSKPTKLFLAVLCFWIVYGTIGILFVSDKVGGFKEVVDIIQNAVIIFSCIVFINMEKIFDTIVTCVKIATAVIAAVFFIQLIAQVYFPFSRYSFDYMTEYYWSKNYMFVPTTLFCNQNDMCATLMFSLVFLHFDFIKNIKISAKIESMLLSIALFIMFSISDSTTACVFSLIAHLASGLWLLLTERNLKNFLGKVSYIAVSGASALVVYKSLGTYVKNLLGHIELALSNFNIGFVDLGNKLSIHSPSFILSSTETVSRILTDKSSPFYLRANLGLEGIRMLIESKGLGVGPNAFKDRIHTDETIDNLVNPHNLWIEILSQYGIIVFLAFSVIFFWVTVRLIKRALKNKEGGMIFLESAAIGFVFTFAVILPSSCLNFYPIWLFVGLMFAVHEFKDTEKAVQNNSFGGNL